MRRQHAVTKNAPTRTMSGPVHPLFYYTYGVWSEHSRRGNDKVEPKHAIRSSGGRNME
jgi:hypothetical protein